MGLIGIPTRPAGEVSRVAHDFSVTSRRWLSTPRTTPGQSASVKHFPLFFALNSVLTQRRR